MFSSQIIVISSQNNVQKYFTKGHEQLFYIQIPNIYLGLGFVFGRQRIWDLVIVCPYSVSASIDENNRAKKIWSCISKLLHFFHFMRYFQIAINMIFWNQKRNQNLNPVSYMGSKDTYIRVDWIETSLSSIVQWPLGCPRLWQIMINSKRNEDI